MTSCLLLIGKVTMSTCKDFRMNKLSIVQMPAGIPVGALAIGKPGSKNAGLLAAAIISIEDKDVAIRLKNFRKKQSDKVRKDPL